jgi:hypothetical protein
MSGHEKLWGTITNGDYGRRGIDVTIQQGVTESVNNNSTDNLPGGEIWTGGGESTLGVAGIQINFMADQECRIFVEQSIDNVNWNIQDWWDIPTTISNMRSLHGRTIQATASYFRVIVMNLSNQATTFLRLQSVLCPVIEALPRSISQEGNLKVGIFESKVAIARRGEQERVKIESKEITEKLNAILTEMQMMNVYLSEMSGIKMTIKDKVSSRWRTN